MDPRSFAPRIPAATSRVLSTASRGPVARAAAKALVAGESVDDAIRVTGGLSEQGLCVSWLPLLPAASSPDDLLTTQQQTVGALNWLATARTDAPDLTIDVATFGILADDVSPGVLINSLREVGQAARNAGVTLTLTVSDARYLQAVLVLGDELRQDFPEVGVVLPTRMRGTGDETVALRASARRVRLSTERLDAQIGTTSARESGNAFVDLTKTFLDAGTAVAFDTDDALLLDIAASLVERSGVEGAEFITPLGMTPSKPRHEAIRRRVVVPYGSEWAPFVARMIGARPSLALSLPNPIRRRS